MRCRAKRCGAFAAIDAVVGLSLMSLLLATLAALGTQHGKTMRALEQRRDAVRLLELSAAEHRAGQAVSDERVMIEPAGAGWLRFVMPSGAGEVDLYVAAAEGGGQ
jgi:hypothetical protein